MAAEQIPEIPKDDFEILLSGWDSIRQQLLVDQDKGDFPRMCFENLMEHAFELGYKIGKASAADSKV